MRLTKIISLLALVAVLAIGCGDECDDINCGANGTCVDGTCQCDEGFSGSNCEINVCDTVDCGDNGSCVNGDCECDTGYEGASCETEAREKYVGNYQGDIIPCLPSLLTGLIPAEDLEQLRTTPLEVFATDSDILIVDIGTSSDILGFSIKADITQESFDVEDFSQELDAGFLTLTVTGRGTGQLVDESTIIMNLTVDFVLPTGELTSECEVTFTKI